LFLTFFFFSSRRRHTRFSRDWSSDVCSSDLKTVDPPPEIAARIRREQAAVAAAREADDPRTDFTETFMRPLQGRVSGRFGNQRRSEERRVGKEGRSRWSTEQ